jgi:hypothetical protein
VDESTLPIAEHTVRIGLARMMVFRNVDLSDRQRDQFRRPVICKGPLEINVVLGALADHLLQKTSSRLGVFAHERVQIHIPQRGGN